MALNFERSSCCRARICRSRDDVHADRRSWWAGLCRARISSTRPVDIMTEEGCDDDDQETIVDIRESEFTVATAGRSHYHPAEGALPALGDWKCWLTDTDGGGRRRWPSASEIVMVLSRATSWTGTGGISDTQSYSWIILNAIFEKLSATSMFSAFACRRINARCRSVASKLSSVF